MKVDKKRLSTAFGIFWKFALVLGLIVAFNSLTAKFYPGIYKYFLISGVIIVISLLSIYWIYLLLEIDEEKNN